MSGRGARACWLTAGALTLAALGAPLGPPPARAHVGTTDAAFEGRAGAYPVRVVVRMPGVIPGQAQVTVRLEQSAS